jgi:hypothetical protein
VWSDVPIDSDALLMTDFVNLKIKPTQSFKSAHRGRMCVRVFIGVSVHTCMHICVYTVFLKKIINHLAIKEKEKKIINHLAIKEKEKKNWLGLVYCTHAPSLPGPWPEILVLSKKRWNTEQFWPKTGYWKYIHGAELEDPRSVPFNIHVMYVVGGATPHGRYIKISIIFH